MHVCSPIFVGYTCFVNYIFLTDFCSWCCWAKCKRQYARSVIDCVYLDINFLVWQEVNIMVPAPTSRFRISFWFFVRRRRMHALAFNGRVNKLTIKKKVISWLLLPLLTNFNQNHIQGPDKKQFFLSSIFACFNLGFMLSTLVTTKFHIEFMSTSRQHLSSPK